MAVGKITTPATWLLGTVSAPSWFQNVQDDINGLLNGTASAAAFVADGTGGNVVSAPSGTVKVSRTAVGTVTPTPTPTLGALYVSNQVVAYLSCTGGTTPSITNTTSAFNISSITRTSTGVYSIVLAAPPATYGVPLGNPLLSPGYTAIAAYDGVSTVTVKTYSGTTATDTGFTMIMVGG